MRILIAEDEAIVRLDLCGILERLGHEVLEARDGGEAVVLAGEWQPELAIFDVKMPVLDGIEAARRITAATPLPIVLLTAYADEATVARAVSVGVFGYLVKPFRESEIAPVLETAWARHLDWLSTRRELGKRLVPPTEAVDIVVEGTHRYPLRIARHADGRVDVTLSDGS